MVCVFYSVLHIIGRYMLSIDIADQWSLRVVITAWIVCLFGFKDTTLCSLREFGSYLDHIPVAYYKSIH